MHCAAASHATIRSNDHAVTRFTTMRSHRAATGDHATIRSNHDAVSRFAAVRTLGRTARREIAVRSDVAAMLCVDSIAAQVAEPAAMDVRIRNHIVHALVRRQAEEAVELPATRSGAVSTRTEAASAKATNARAAIEPTGAKLTRATIEPART
jgi:hypothetical protein